MVDHWSMTSEGCQQSDDHTNIHNGIVELNYVSIVVGWLMIKVDVESGSDQELLSF